MENKSSIFQKICLIWVISLLFISACSVSIGSPVSDLDEKGSSQKAIDRSVKSEAEEKESTSDGDTSEIQSKKENKPTMLKKSTKTDLTDETKTKEKDSRVELKGSDKKTKAIDQKKNKNRKNISTNEVSISPNKQPSDDVTITSPNVGENIWPDATLDFDCSYGSTGYGNYYVNIRRDGNLIHTIQSPSDPSDSYSFSDLSSGQATLEVELMGEDTSIKYKGVEPLATEVDSDTVDVSVVAFKSFTIDSPGKWVNKKDVTVEWSVDSHYDLYSKVRVDGNSWNRLESSKKYTFNNLNEGQHTVDVYIEDNDGNTETKDHTFTIDTTAPTADPGGSYSGDEDTQIDMDGSGSTDENGISSYKWDLDNDDNFDDDSGSSISHTWNDPGTYILGLKVIDAAGNSDDGFTSVEVNDVTSPTADSGGSYSRAEDTSIAFDGTGSTDNGDIDSYDWDWTNDGTYEGSGATPSHTYSTPGDYTVKLKITDGGGNTDTDTASVTVKDTTDPIADAGGPYSGDEDSSINFNASGSSDNGEIASFSWDLDDDATYDDASGIKASKSWTDPGTYTIGLKVTDTANNTDTITTNVTVEDITPPTADAGGPYSGDEDTSIAFDASNSTDNGNIHFRWDLDNDGGYDDGNGSYISRTWDDPGTYKISVKVTDSGGNKDTDETEVTVYDTTAPNADAGDSYSVDEDTSITFDGSNSTDNGNIVSYDWDWTNDGTYEGSGAMPSHTYSNPGDYTVKLKITDGGGNTDTDTANVTVKDTTPPEVNIEKPSDNSVHNSSSVTMFWNASDNVGIDHYEVSQDSKSYIGVGTDLSYDFTDMSEGQHTLSVKAIDSSGNQANVNINITVDTSAPLVDHGGPYSGDEDTSITLDASNSSDEITSIASYEWDLDNDGTYEEANGSSVSKIWSEPGNYTIGLKVIDEAGNLETKSTTVTVHDNTTPSLEIISPDDGTIYNKSVVAFNWNSSDNVGIDHFEIKHDSTSYLSVEQNESYEFQNLSDGSHILYVKSVDAAGNFATDNISVIVDTTKPDIEIVSPNKGRVYSSDDIRVNWSISTNATQSYIIKNEIKMDNESTWENLSLATNKTFTSLSDGHYKVYIRVTDEAGNAARVNTTFTVDTGIPDVEIEAPTDGQYFDENSVEVKWNGSDNTTSVSYQFKLNESEEGWMGLNDSTSKTLENLSEGHYRAYIRATDEAGNSATVNITFIVDTTSPRINITAPREDSIFDSTSVKVSWNGSAEISGLDYYKLKVNGELKYKGKNETYRLNGLSKGENRLILTAKDRAGNMASSEINITIDVDPPEVSITAPGENEVIKDNSLKVNWRSWNNDTRLDIDQHSIYLDGEKIDTDMERDHYIFDNLSKGQHTVEVKAIDEAGNEGMDGVTFYVKIPSLDVNITSPKNGTFSNANNIEVMWNTTLGAYDLDRYVLEIDGRQVYNGTQSRYTLENIAEGKHTITLTAHDEGNDHASDLIFFTLDRTGPEIDITSPEEDEVYFTKNIEVRWEGVDNISSVDHYSLVLDQREPIRSYNGTEYEFSSVDSGEHMIEVRAVDTAGNEALKSVRFETLSKRVIEKAEINDGKSNTTQRKISIDITLTGGSNATSIRIALDKEFNKKSTGWIEYEDPISYKLPSERGNYSVYLEVKTKKGLKSRTVSKEISYQSSGDGDDDGKDDLGEIHLKYTGVSTIIFEQNLEYELQWNNSGKREIDRYKLIANSSRKSSAIAISNLKERNFTYKFERSETVKFELIAFSGSGKNESITFEVKVDLIETKEVKKDWRPSESEKLSLDIPKDREDDVSVIWYVDGEAEATGFEFEPELKPGEYNITAEISSGSGEVKKSKEFNVDVERKTDGGIPYLYILTGGGLIAGIAVAGAVLYDRRMDGSMLGMDNGKKTEDLDHESGSLEQKEKETRENSERSQKSSSIAGSEMKGKKVGVPNGSSSDLDGDVGADIGKTSLGPSEAVKMAFEEMERATKNEAHHHLTTEKDIQISFDEFEEEIEELVREEKLAKKPQRSKPDLYIWKEK